MLLREARRNLEIQFIKARNEHIVMLPLAVRDRDENRARFRGTAPKHAPVLTGASGGPCCHSKPFTSLLKPQGLKGRVEKVKWGEWKPSHSE